MQKRLHLLFSLSQPTLMESFHIKCAYDTKFATVGLIKVITNAAQAVTHDLPSPI
jgi:hypothetical protein